MLVRDRRTCRIRQRPQPLIARKTQQLVQSKLKYREYRMYVFSGQTSTGLCFSGGTYLVRANISKGLGPNYCRYGSRNLGNCYCRQNLWRNVQIPVNACDNKHCHTAGDKGYTEQRLDTQDSVARHFWGKAMVTLTYVVLLSACTLARWLILILDISDCTARDVDITIEGGNNTKIAHKSSSKNGRINIGRGKGRI